MSNLANLGILPSVNMFNGYFIPLPTLVSGTATFSHDDVKKVQNKSLRVNCTNLDTTPVIINFGDYYEFITPEQRSYLFAICFNSAPVIEMTLRVYLNGFLTNEYDFNTDGSIDSGFFQRFGQLMPNVLLDEFNFDIVIKSNPLLVGTQSIWFDAPSLTPQIGDSTENAYKKGGNPTLWADRTDLVNTQNLIASTNNVVQITTATEGNGYEFDSFFDANGKVIPINVNDVITVDFACTVETPSGADRFVDIRALVDGVIYRAKTHKLLKGSGNDDHLSVSWSFPVKSALKLNGLQIALNPNSNCTIKERYISVTRIHEAL